MEIDKLLHVIKNLKEELYNASQGNNTSIPYIYSRLPNNTEQKNDSMIQVLTVGGSVFKKGLFSRTNNKYSLISSSEKQQPVFHSGDDLLRLILTEYDEQADQIVVNLAYPVKPTIRDGRVDGILLKGMKENSFTGLLGKEIGYEIERAIYEKNQKRIRTSVANDTICLLLSGLHISSRDKLSAAVIGTGINIAFFTNMGEAINTEVANFDKFSLSPEAVIIDNNSSSPGHALFEKEIAGAYLYQHFNLVAAKQLKDTTPISSTHELDIIAQGDSEEGRIAKNILDRSAKYSAALFAATCAHKQSDLNIVMEGSLFWHGYKYKETVEQTIHQLQLPFTITFHKVSHSSLVGASYLAD